MTLYSNIRRIFWIDRNIWKSFRSFEKTKKIIDNAFSEITFFQINLNHRLNVTWIIFLYRWSFVVLILESFTAWMRICVELTSCLVSASWSLQCWPRRLALGVSLVQFRSRIVRLVTRRPCSQISAAPPRIYYLDRIVLVSPFRSRNLRLVVSVL